MAREARLGLKLIERFHTNVCLAGEMACGARSGLKLITPALQRCNGCWLNGLWSPFGIETLSAAGFLKINVKAKWPVEPVRD